MQPLFSNVLRYPYLFSRNIQVSEGKALGLGFRGCFKAEGTLSSS